MKRHSNLMDHVHNITCLYVLTYIYTQYIAYSVLTSKISIKSSWMTNIDRSVTWVHQHSGIYGKLLQI